MAARYIAKTYGPSAFKWAIAGRRRQALEVLRSSLGSHFNELPIIIADAHDVTAIHALANSGLIPIFSTGFA
jgi:short subunit dehydrogenase-like uncharacterized protein